MSNTNWAIIVAGGAGKRMNMNLNKVFAKLGKFQVLYFSLAAFEKSKIIDRVVISAAGVDLPKIKKLVSKHKFKKVVDIVPALMSRQESTLAVLESISDSAKLADLVGVHNGANPFVSMDEIKKVYSDARSFGAALLAQPARDTVKISNQKGVVIETPIREYSWYAQTPQVSTFGKLYKAHLKAKGDKFSGTDDAQLLERIGVKVKIVPCSDKNFKITFPQDLVVASHILKTWTE